MPIDLLADSQIWSCDDALSAAVDTRAIVKAINPVTLQQQLESAFNSPGTN